MLVENLPAPTDPRVWAEATTLRDQGFQVSIICPKGESRDKESYAFIENIHIYRYHLPTTTGKASDYIREYSVAMLMTFWLTLKVWLRHGFDVIHIANPPDTYFIIGMFFRLFGRKYVFDQHDLAPEMFHVKFQDRMKLLYKVLLFFERCSYRTAHLILTTNEFQKKMAIERGGSTASKVFVVRNGPDLAHFTSVTPEPELRKANRYLLVYIGVMGVQDGVEYALYALSELIHKRGRQDVSFVLMGEGDQLATLKSLTHKLNLDAHVTFAGWVAGGDKLRYLRVADVGLSPDPSNELNDHSTMHKTMEYMAMGKPVVAFDLPETRFSAQDAALYATPNCLEEFVNHIETLLNNEELRLTMGANGRKRIEKELSWDHSKKNLLLAYEILLNRCSK